MRVLQKDDYANLAKEAVAQLVTNQVPLVDSLVKVSDSMGLNPDQISSLVQVANTLAHLDMFDRKNGGDKNVSFDLADPVIVIKKVVTSGPSESTLSAPSSDTGSAIQDFFGDLPDSSGCEDSALANVGAPVTSTPESMSPERKQLMIIKIRKVAEELNYRKMAADMEYEEEVSKLASEFAKLYGPDYQSFEKDAVDLSGGNAISILTDLRTALRMPRIKIAVFEKSARLVDTDTSEMKSFQKLCSLVERSKECEAALMLLQHEMGESK